MKQLDVPLWPIVFDAPLQTTRRHHISCVAAIKNYWPLQRWNSKYYLLNEKFGLAPAPQYSFLHSEKIVGNNRIVKEKTVKTRNEKRRPVPEKWQVEQEAPRYPAYRMVLTPNAQPNLLSTFLLLVYPSIKYFATQK